LKAALRASSPNTTHHLCQWRAAQNIKARIIKGWYSEERRQEIMHRVWFWLKCNTEEILEENPAELLILLDEAEQ
jgi:hypothetical protein